MVSICGNAKSYRPTDDLSGTECQKIRKGAIMNHNHTIMTTNCPELVVTTY